MGSRKRNVDSFHKESGTVVKVKHGEAIEGFVRLSSTAEEAVLIKNGSE